MNIPTYERYLWCAVKRFVRHERRHQKMFSACITHRRCSNGSTVHTDQTPDTPPVERLENPHERFLKTIARLEHIPYAEQLQIKKEYCKVLAQKLRNIFEFNIRMKYLPEQLVKHLEHNGGLPFHVTEVVPSPVIEGYRNKDSPVIGEGYDGQTEVGFYVRAGQKKYVATGPNKTQKTIHLQIQEAFKEVVKNSGIPHRILGHASEGGNWRKLFIRSNQEGDVMMSIQVQPAIHGLDSDMAKKVKDLSLDFAVHGPGNFFNIKSLQFQQSHLNILRRSESPYELLYGLPYIEEKLFDCKFKISPDTFFQVNTTAAEVLYDNVREMCNLTKNTVLLDVCCGTGTIGIVLGKHVSQVIGVEKVRQAVDDAIINAEMNGVENAAYVCGSAEKKLSSLLDGAVLRSGEADIVAIVNPGRSGLGEGIIRAIRNCEAIRKVLYISCKPYGRPLQNFKWLCQAPFHQDKKIIGSPFLPTDVRAVDMFPHTKYFELVVLFER